MRVEAMTAVGLEQRECPVCPAGIKMCAHLDGRVVWLTDNKAAAPHSGNYTDIEERWCVTGPNVPVPCRCGSGHIAVPNKPLCYVTDSLAEAEAEYERRCALLRAGP